MSTASRNPIRAVIFDIGGVVIGSPVVGVGIYEAAHGLPSHYINCSITALGQQGAFQRLERGEIELEQFYSEFGDELSAVGRANEAYNKYCTKMGIEVPTLPTKLAIDGKDLWTIMMAQASDPDDNIVTAINLLRESNLFKLAALTNNFIVPSSSPAPLPRQKGHLSTVALKASFVEAALDPDAAGAPTHLLRSLFDDFFESAVEGMRKPDPAFYQLALDRLGVKAEEAVFLDDIGINLAAAKKLGIHTIRVLPNRSMEAVLELENLVGIPLRKSAAKL